MKILHVISSMDPTAGGTSQAIRNIIPNLQKIMVENDVVCLDDPNRDYENKDDFSIFKLGKGKTSYQYHALLLDWLQEHLYHYEAVVVHGIWQFPNYAVYKAIKRLKKQKQLIPKVIIMPHGMLDPYFQQEASRKWKALRNELVWQLTEKRAVNAADAFFFTCEEELLLARNTFKGYYPKKEINVGFGIERPPLQNNQMLPQFQQTVPLLKNNYWLFLSRIHPKKGVDLLIEAYNAICAKVDKIPDLVIAGPTDSVYAQQMIALAQHNPKIHFTGMLSGDAKWGAFYGCDAYLLPSHQENFGIAIVEAMACKKPVMITKHINIWREIEAGKGGWVLATLSAAVLESKLIEIEKLDNMQLDQIGLNAYATFEKQFSVQQQASVFATTIQEL